MGGHTRDPGRPDPLAITVTAAAVLLVLLLAWRSLPWPLIHDAPLMHYVAARMAAGDVPYRDLFDMNLPGTYALHGLLVSLAGPGDGAWRAFDLAWLGLTVSAFYIYGRSLGVVGALFGAALFAAYHLAAGPVEAGQRDYLIILPLLVAAHLLVSHLEGGEGARRLVGAGILLGGAVLLKPTPLLLAGLWGLWAAGVAFKRGESPAQVLGWIMVGGVLPLVAAGAWLVHVGAFAAFGEVFGSYVLPLYSKVGRSGLRGFLSPRHLMYLGLLVGLAVGAAGLAHRAGGLGVRRVALLVGMGYGLVHYAAQGKGWGYHLMPMAAFACALVGAGVRPASEGGRWSRHLLWAAGTLLLVATGAKGLRGGGIGPEVARRTLGVRALEQELGPCLVGGGTVQVLETAQGGIHALLRLGARQPTRFIYDFVFLHDVDAPYIQGLRAELIAGLEAHPPACVVLSERGWPSGGYERYAGFPALMAFIERGYALRADLDGFRIYAQAEDRAGDRGL